MLKAQHKSCSLGTTSSPQPGETTHTLSFERWCLMEWNSPNEQTSQRLDPKLVEPHSPVPFQNSEFEDWQTPQQQIFKRHNDTICTTIRWVVMTCHCCTPILSHCLSLRLLSVDSGCKPSRACWSQPALCWHSQHWSSPNNHPGISCRCCDITTCRKLYRKSCGKSKLKRSKKLSPPSLSRLNPNQHESATLNSLLQKSSAGLTSDVAYRSTCGAARPMPSPGDPGEGIHPQMHYPYTKSIFVQLLSGRDFARMYLPTNLNSIIWDSDKWKL